MKTTLLRELWARRVPQVVGGYAAFAWGLVQFIDWFAGRNGWPSSIAEVVFAFLFSMLPGVGIATWFSGHLRLQHVAVATNLLLAMGLGWVTFGLSKDAEPSERRQLTFLGTAFAPVYSPDGNEIALLASDTLGWHVLRIQLADLGRVDTLYSRYDVALSSLKWSKPDGLTVLAYSQNFSISTDGQGATHLNQAPHFGTSRDGTWSVGAYQNSSALSITQKTGNGRGDVLSLSLPEDGSAVFIHALSWSPTADVIALHRVASDGARIDILSPTGRSWDLLRAAPTIHSMHWSGDGSALYWVEGETLFERRVEPSTGEPEGDSKEVSREIRGTLVQSLDGEDVIVSESSVRSTVRLIRIAPNDADPYRTVLSLSTSASAKTALSINHNGSSVAWFDPAHDSALIVRSVDRGSEVVLPVGGRPLRTEWSPRGDEIAALIAGVPKVIVRRPIDGETIDTVGVDVGDGIEWCADDRILYQLFGNNDYRVHKPRVAQPRLLFGPRSRGWMFSPACSPDGQSVAFYYNRQDRAGLWVVSIDGEEETLLVPSRSSISPQPVGWSPDGQWLYLTFRGERPYGVHRVSLSGGAPELVISLPANTTDVAMARDGSAIATIETETLTDLWLRKGFRGPN